MKKICCAIALWSLCSGSAMTATQDPERKLTKAAIDDAVRDLKGVELTLWDHAGVKTAGSSTVIRGDGTVLQSWTPYYPMSAEEKTSTCRFRLTLSPEEVRGILRLFAVDEVLSLPKTRTDLVGARETRFTLSLSISGVGSFEGEHPNIDWSKLPQSPAAQELIRKIRSSVQELAARVAREDEKVLANDRLLQRTDGFALELWDVHGLWGGESVRVHADGRVEGISVDRGVKIRHFKGTVEKSRPAGILKQAAELGTFDLKPKRQNGIPDEARPILVVQATIDGATYSRSVALWEGEVRELPAFQQVRKALQEIAIAQLKK